MKWSTIHFTTADILKQRVDMTIGPFSVWKSPTSCLLSAMLRNVNNPPLTALKSYIKAMIATVFSERFPGVLSK